MTDLKILKVSVEPIYDLDIDEILEESFLELSKDCYLPSKLKPNAVVIVENQCKEKLFTVVESVFLGLEDEMFIDIDFIDPAISSGKPATFKFAIECKEYYLRPALPHLYNKQLDSMYALLHDCITGSLLS